MRYATPIQKGGAWHLGHCDVCGRPYVLDREPAPGLPMPPCDHQDISSGLRVSCNGVVHVPSRGEPLGRVRKAWRAWRRKAPVAL